MAMKRARKNTGSRTPFEILTGANGYGPESAQDKALWVEYVKAVKGRQQATCSAGLTFEVETEEEASLSSDIIAGLGQQAVLELDKTGMTADLLDQVEQQAGDPDGVRETVEAVLLRLKTRDWRMFRLNEAAGEIEHGRENAKHDAETEALKDADGWRRKADHWDKLASRIPDTPEQQIATRMKNKQQLRAEQVYIGL